MMIVEMEQQIINVTATPTSSAQRVNRRQGVWAFIFGDIAR